MYKAYVIELKHTREHPNAHSLFIAEPFYSVDVITRIDTGIKEGDKILFFPTDGIINEEFCKDNKLLREDGGYINPDRRVKAISLRGAKSHGMIMPIEVLSKYTDVNKLKDGEQIDVLNGVEICKKYIPGGKKKNAGPSHTQKKKHRVKYPNFIQHCDTSQLRYNLNNFKRGDEIIITEKLHSSSGRSANTIKQTNRLNWLSNLLRLKRKPKKEWEYIMGSRRVNIPLNKVTEHNTMGFHGGNKFRLAAHNQFKDKLHKGEEVFYEIIGYDDKNRPIMPIVSNEKLKDEDFIKRYGKETHFRYGLDEGNDIYVYRMGISNEDGYFVDYSWDMVKFRCSEMGVKTVPELERFYFTNVDNLLDRVDNWIDGSSKVDPTHLMEGAVLRVNNKPGFVVYKDKSYNFKVLEGITKDKSDKPDMEEAEEEYNNS